ncbi:MAG: hypothetical protein LWW86_14450 [Micrococcales bacterium]|nr:hypothetical protein [Micrococcales bacterium]
MARKGFGSELWKTTQGVRLGKDGGNKAPVRASSRQGIVVGHSAVSKSDARRRRSGEVTEGARRGFLRRLFGRR